MIINVPFVMTDVKNPTNEPIPVLNDCLMPERDTINSAIIAPRNGPRIMPATGMTKGPRRSPIVLPHMPAFDPPNLFTPTRFDNVSATNNKRMNKPWTLQKSHVISSNDTIKP